MKFIFLIAVSFSAIAQPKGVLLENLTWPEAEKVLTPKTIVVIPLGAASKEHGPHLLLKNDLILAEYLKERVHQSANVVIAPTINYHFYPSFMEYPGSTSLKLNTARDMVIDICSGLSRFGPTKFYILNANKVLHSQYRYFYSACPKTGRRLIIGKRNYTALHQS